MSTHDPGRTYQRSYLGVQRGKHHAFVNAAIETAGGRVLASTGGGAAPLFVGIELGDGQRLAACMYVFLANQRTTRNRPIDEHRLQVRYGDVNSQAWREQDHPVGFDPLGSDVTAVLGVHPQANLILGLDPFLYDPLPIGISVEFKDAEIKNAQRSGWHVWERDNVSGLKRAAPRSALGVETIVAFAPHRLLDYLRFERDAQALRLDPSLRYARAETASDPEAKHDLHALEEAFDLSGREILDLIGERPRLGMAVKGGVAERHLEKVLNADSKVADVAMGEAEGPPDFIINVARSGEVTVECKNASPVKYADGTPKVEAQKTRASQGDPRSRFYEISQFDVLAACMFGPWGRWEFRYKRSERLARHQTYPDRIAPMQRVDDSWSATIAEALE